jgi:hypothetical protein
MNPLLAARMGVRAVSESQQFLLNMARAETRFLQENGFLGRRGWSKIVDMKKVKTNDDDMLPEYDFSGVKGVRGKYYKRMQQGYTIKIHKADGTTIVKEVPAHLVTLIPHKRKVVVKKARGLIAKGQTKKPRTAMARDEKGIKLEPEFSSRKKEP